MNFKDWFYKKLEVNSFPFMNNEHVNAFEYDYVINVSDEFYLEHHFPFQVAGCKTFWFPMNECKRDIGLNSIYGALNILWLAEQDNKCVYLHCHAGVNRSQAVRAAYYYMRTGEHFEPEIKRNGYLNSLLAMCNRGYLPPKSELEKFLTQLGKHLQSNDMMGGLLDQIKLDTINNF